MLGGIASGTNITLRQGGAVVVRGNTLPSQRALHTAPHTVQANCIFVYLSMCICLLPTSAQGSNS